MPAQDERHACAGGGNGRRQLWSMIRKADAGLAVKIML
jgi:hypothetical protein